MSHGGDFPEQGSTPEPAATKPLPAAPPIRGPRPLDPNPAEKSPPLLFDPDAPPAPGSTARDPGDVFPPAEPTLFDDVKPRSPNETGEPPSPYALDPWGAQEYDDDEPQDPDPEPPTRKRGGGTLTIPLMCVGVAIIACVTLLPMADDLHQLAWEREKLKLDLAHLKEQVRVNDEFLARVADDPTLAERLAQRQMKVIRDGQRALPVRAGFGREETSPFQLVSVPPPPPMPPYQPVGGMLATLVRQPRARLYLSGGGLLLVAIGLVLGYVPKDENREPDEK